MEVSNAKKIANVLLNLPTNVKIWTMENIAPETLARWCRQSSVALKPYRNTKEKVMAVYSGAEELSELAKYEYLNK